MTTHTAADAWRLIADNLTGFVQWGIAADLLDECGEDGRITAAIRFAAMHHLQLRLANPPDVGVPNAYIWDGPAVKRVVGQGPMPPGLDCLTTAVRDRRFAYDTAGLAFGRLAAAMEAVRCSPA